MNNTRTIYEIYSNINIIISDNIPSEPVGFNGYIRGSQWEARDLYVPSSIEYPESNLHWVCIPTSSYKYTQIMNGRICSVIDDNGNLAWVVRKI